jgi:hypothetical protein
MNQSEHGTVSVDEAIGFLQAFKSDDVEVDTIEITIGWES